MHRHSFWVVRHDLVDSYLVSVSPRRWGAFEQARRFGSKDAAVLFIDSICPGCLAIQVNDYSEAPPDEAPELLDELAA